MNRIIALAVVSAGLLGLGACRSHLELQYPPQEYARLRKIELLTTPPVRNYALVATVEGRGGRLTATDTMINAMIDEASKAGADALIPLEFARSDQAQGLDLFVFSEHNRFLARGRAIRWSTYGDPP